MQGCVRRCTKLHNPNWIPGCIFEKICCSVHPALVLFNKGLWSKNKRKQKQQRTDSPFSIKGATHLTILMPINNHAKDIRTRQTNLPTSSRFPFVSWPCDPWCYEEGSYPRYWVWNSNHERWVKIHNMTNNIFEKKTWYPQRNTERGHDEKILSFPGVFSFFCLRSFEMDIRLPRLAQNLAK